VAHTVDTLEDDVASKRSQLEGLVASASASLQQGPERRAQQLSQAIASGEEQLRAAREQYGLVKGRNQDELVSANPGLLFLLFFSHSKHIHTHTLPLSHSGTLSSHTCFSLTPAHVFCSLVAAGEARPGAGGGLSRDVQQRGGAAGAADPDLSRSVVAALVLLCQPQELTPETFLSTRRALTLEGRGGVCIRLNESVGSSQPVD
jgi:hypothetical protein